MTDEQKQNDANRYVVVNGNSNVIEGTYEAEGEAKSASTRLAENHDNTEFIVYQKIGSSKLEPKVVWKGAAR